MSVALIPRQFGYMKFGNGKKYNEVFMYNYDTNIEMNFNICIIVIKRQSKLYVSTYVSFIPSVN